MNNRRLLLLSNSRVEGHGYLGHAADEIKDFLGSSVTEVLFVPYAGVTISFDDYAGMTRKVFEKMGFALRSIHSESDPRAAVTNAQAIAVGGGNTFHLTSKLYEFGLIDIVHERCASGMPYMGWSAGANMACPTIRTTNDMPIVQPPSFDAFSLVPFQINPHYLDADPDSRHMGETRETRLREYLEENAGPVLALREGCWLHVEGDTVRLGGERAARLFRRDTDAKEIAAGENLDYLLRVSSE